MRVFTADQDLGERQKQATAEADPYGMTNKKNKQKNKQQRQPLSDNGCRPVRKV
jgi:hypothetical protein